MEVKIIWTVLAETQLKDIFDYYLSKAGLRIAKKIITKIVDRVSILESNPLAGPKEDLLLEYIEEYRYLVEKNYKIIYWINDNYVTIATVFDCRQNPVKMKFIDND